MNWSEGGRNGGKENTALTTKPWQGRRGAPRLKP